MLSLLTALSLTQPGPCRLREPLKDKGHVKILWEKFRLLTVFVSAEVGFGFGGRLRLSGLVDSDHSELVPLALTKAGHASLQLVNSRHAVLVVSDEGVKPASELVFLLDDVVADGTAAIALRLLPPECDGFVVKVDNLGFTRLAGRSYNTQVRLWTGHTVRTYCMGSRPGWDLL